MISDCFRARWVLARIRSGSVGPYVDGLVATLTGAGFGGCSLHLVEAAAADHREPELPDQTCHLRGPLGMPRCCQQSKSRESVAELCEDFQQK